MDRKQQMLLDQLFKAQKIWWEEVWGLTFGGIFLVGATMVIWVMPWQVWKDGEDYRVLMMMLGLELMGIFLYLQKFWTYRENGQVKLLYDVLKDIPVSCRQLSLYGSKKVVKICVWITGISIFFQTVSAIALMHTFSAGNILMPFICNFIVPLSFVGLRELVSIRLHLEQNHYNKNEQTENKK